MRIAASENRIAHLREGRDVGGTYKESRVASHGLFVRHARMTCGRLKVRRDGPRTMRGGLRPARADFRLPVMLREAIEGRNRPRSLRCDPRRVRADLRRRRMKVMEHGWLALRDRRQVIVRRV